MTKQEPLTNDHNWKSIVKKMWLNYFNNRLLEKCLITEAEHWKMKVYRRSRKPSA